MASKPSKAGLHGIQTLFSLGAAGGLTDAQLLQRFVSRIDEPSGSAFATLVERHGPMVLGVCRRILANPLDAEDAFQATFLVLIRKAGSIARPESLANWLFGVARRTAKEARARAIRRQEKEGRRVIAVACAPDADEELRRDLRAVLDEELGRLPEKYRLPVVLCELEGRSRSEVAGLLGLSEGTLSSRLARARVKLRERLSRRGLALPVGVLATELTREASAVPVELTARATAWLAKCHSASVATLAEGVIKAMLLTKLKAGVGLMLVIGTLAVGAGVMAQPKPAGPIANDPGAAAKAGADPPKGKRPLLEDAPAKEQLDLIERALNALDRLAAGGEIRFNDAAFSIWGRRKLEALRASGAEKAQVVAGFEEYLVFMKKQEEAVTVLYKKDRCTRQDVWDVQYRRLEAEIWLNQEKAR